MHLLKGGFRDARDIHQLVNIKQDKARVSRDRDRAASDTRVIVQDFAAIACDRKIRMLEIPCFCASVA